MARERVLSSSLSKEYFEEDSRTVLTNLETLLFNQLFCRYRKLFAAFAVGVTKKITEIMFDELGLVARETPFGADSHGKKSLYRIADHFLNFWYTFVQSNLSRDDFLESANERKIFESQYEVYLGGVWERLVRETLRMKPLPGTDMRWQNMARWWGAGLDHHPMELDIVAESPDGDTLLVGEAKLSVREDEAPHLLSLLESRAGNLPFSAKYKRIVTRLFVADNPPPDAVSLAWCEESP